MVKKVVFYTFLLVSFFLGGIYLSYVTTGLEPVPPVAGGHGVEFTDPTPPLAAGGGQGSVRDLIIVPISFDISWT